MTCPAVTLISFSQQPMRLMLSLPGSESWQEADGTLQGVTEVRAMRGALPEVWAGLMETTRGDEASGA